jgi:phosphoglucosamine mutase
VRSAGVLPTPAVSLLARGADFDAGIVISASHNAYDDNGLKVFAGNGTKLADDLEREVEAAFGADAPPQREAGPPPLDEPELQERYAAWLLAHGRRTGAALDGLVLAIDCANGAASALAAPLLRDLGADVRSMADEPDGRNINAGCGSLHPEGLARLVRNEGADLGIAFDGDADRALFVDGEGRLVDGDEALLVTADHLLRAGRLRGGVVVGTVMSNFGLEQALSRRGLTLERAPVGDRFVRERMQQLDCNLGGEPSGHLIFLDEAPTGDGLLTTLQVLAAVVSTGRSLAELASEMQRTPQLLRNVRVARRVPLDEVAGWPDLSLRWQRRLGGSGRLLVRYSGTEPLVRVMAEGTDAELVAACVAELADHLAAALGGP